MHNYNSKVVAAKTIVVKQLLEVRAYMMPNMDILINQSHF